MSIKQFFKTQRDNYVIRQVQRAKLPPFPHSPFRRYEVRFSGRVQKVGFRLELSLLAQRLGLTGQCQNLASGDVLAQIQGPDAKIHYLLAFMESLKRIQIRRKTVVPMAPVPEETGFLRL